MSFYMRVCGCVKLQLNIGNCQRWRHKEIAQLLTAAFPQAWNENVSVCVRVILEKGQKKGGELHLCGWLLDKMPLIGNEVRQMVKG